MALRKLTRVTESVSLEFRFETFDTFNHAQFDGAAVVDGAAYNWVCLVVRRKRS